jgi:hypothetical protein
VTKKLARGWRMAGGVLFTVTRGDGGRLSNQRGVGTAGRRGFPCLRAEPPPLTHVCG